MNASPTESGASGLEIAVVGMAGRFPGAASIDQFWRNLEAGVESVTFFSDEELRAAGVAPSLLGDPKYVKAAAVLDGIDSFDASFFGFNPREAEILDPQHRLFLECAWEALENAGYDGERYKGAIGVYAGASKNRYVFNLYSEPEILESVGGYQINLGNEGDYAPTRVSYKLNLRGPSVNIQTACSTSLVAVHLACQSLLSGECDMALAGGVSVSVPRRFGYLYQQGMIYSPDGHCRAFDANARGIVGGDGLGIVVLKRLADAVSDGDCIYAVIKGTAINNDGSLKIGYTAPSVDGQARVIRAAHAMAEIDPETITYVECHGTGTELGDPIEVAALTKAFRAGTQKKGFCGIGSVKTNFGHLNTAAGVAGLIKTVLALKHKKLPPSLHFERPNPKIDFDNSPFYVNDKLREWEPGEAPRRAGVSSFGIGGTNAHVVLEEAPAVEPFARSRPWQLIVLSAKTETALETATRNLSEHLKQHPEVNLADVAYTLQLGRRAFDYRRVLVCRDVDDARHALESLDANRVFTAMQDSNDRQVVFMFPGQGSQYVNMALGLYQSESQFRKRVDDCSEFLQQHLGLDLRRVLYPPDEEIEKATRQLNQTALAQPALFVVEYALARTLMDWGIQPQAMIGHSIGEYVAACLAGVFSLEDALMLVAARGRLMNQLPGGAMLAVPLPDKELQPLLGQELSLAATNGPSSSVVSGPNEAVDRFEKELSGQGVQSRRLHTSHAFHSQMMDPILAPLAEQVHKVELHAPKLPYLSNVTGAWITAAEATDPAYWPRHLRQAVRFAEGMEELLKEPLRILLEVGPGQTLSALAKHQAKKTAKPLILSSTRHPQEVQPDSAFLLNALGKLWLAGIRIDWTAFYHEERRRRLALPTYPFERQRYWIEGRAHHPRAASDSPRKRSDVADWFYTPSWKRSVPPDLLSESVLGGEQSTWLAFVNERGLGQELVQRLVKAGQNVVTVRPGERFEKQSDLVYTIRPDSRDDYDALLKDLRALDRVPKRLLHFWSVAPNDTVPSGLDRFETAQEMGFYSLLFIKRALGQLNAMDSVRIEVFSSDMQQVTGDEALKPEKATILGLCNVIPKEYSGASCRSIDVVLPEPGSSQEQELLDKLTVELMSRPADSVVAYRANSRWVQIFEPVRLEPQARATTLLKEGGVYLITGGLGGVGLILAEHLARAARAKLVLTGRSEFPPKNEWQRYLAAHDDGQGTNGSPRAHGTFHPESETDYLAAAEKRIKEDMGIRRLGSYNGVEEALNRLCSSYIYGYFRDSGIEVKKGKTYPVETLKTLLRILPKFDKFYRLMLKILMEDGFVKLEDDHVHFLKDPDELERPENLRPTLEKKHSEFKGLLALLAHCVGSYRQALSGEIEAIGVLYPDGSSSLLDEASKNTVEYKELRVYRHLAQEVIHRAARQSTTKPLRILEVGGGRGQLTRLIAPGLKDHNVEYHFTDIGKTFVSKAREEAEKNGFDHMRFGVLDISKDPENQGYRSSSFDIVLGLNVVHATPSVQGTLANLKKLLTPGGALCLIESVKAYRWDDLIWGLAEGWWYFSDTDLRESSPLLSLDRWEQVLRQQGFCTVQGYPTDERERELTDCGLIVAQEPRRANDAPESSLTGLARRIRKIQELENLGAEVVVAKADASNLDQMRSVISDTHRRFGQVNGVIHAAGIEGGGLVQLLTREAASEELSAKARGALVLEALLGSTKLDFLVLCSSLSSIIGSLGKAGYSAANAFLDHFAQFHSSKKGTVTVSVNWDRWKNIGLAVDVETRHKALTGEDLEEGITAEEGARVFEYLLSSRTLPQIVVSTRDFQALIERDRELKGSDSLKPFAQTVRSIPSHRRPELNNTYVAPRSKIEKKIAGVWQEVLGIEQVGIHDSFLSLGGDSLIALQILGRLRKTFEMELPLTNLFNSPTVAQLAEQIETILWAAQDGRSSGVAPDGERVEIKL